MSDIRYSNQPAAHVGGFRAPAFHARSAYLQLRRTLDLVFIVLAAPAALLLTGVCALARLCVMGRPVFFTQNRVGKSGRIFRMHKLRTMCNCDSKAVLATARNDPRITPLGRFLRRSHL